MRDRLIRLAESHPERVLGYQDETWGRPPALPETHARTDEGRPLQRVEQTLPKGDPARKALSCYGQMRADTVHLLLQIVAGRPDSQSTEDDLACVCERLPAEGKKA